MTTKIGFMRSLPLLSAALLVTLPSLTTHAQSTSTTAPPPNNETLSFEAAPAPAAPPNSAVQLSSLHNAQLLTAQLVELEQRAIAIEQERATIRTTGLKVGKYISWSVFGVLAATALGQFGRVAMIEEAIDDGRNDEYYDSNGDGEVDDDDVERTRRVARGLIIGSLVPLGLGIYTTVVGRMRARHIGALDAQLTDLRDRRRSVLKNLSMELGASNTHASLGMRLVF